MTKINIHKTYTYIYTYAYTHAHTYTHTHTNTFDTKHTYAAASTVQRGRDEHDTNT